MSLAVVLGPELASIAPDISPDGVEVRVREVDESAAARAAMLRSSFGSGAGVVLLVDRATPVRPSWLASGDLFALVSDHVNLTGDNPLVGPNADEWGPRFPDLTEAWDSSLRGVLRRAMLATGVHLPEGVVAGVASASRTASEMGMLRMIGVDMASEGFVHEAIVAGHAGRRIAGIAVLAAPAELPGETARIGQVVREAMNVLAAEATAESA